MTHSSASRATRVVLAVVLGVPLYAAAQSWDVCVYDTLYSSVDYQFNRESTNSRVIRGLAYDANGSPSFPAPIAGTYNPQNDSYSFTVGYLNDNSRYYWVDGTGKGKSWAILGSDSEYYETPRSAQLMKCSTRTAPTAPGPTGAQ